MITLPNFEKLKVFHAIYLGQSIQGAADALYVTRSAISQSLKGLEEELGVRLFIRSSKKFSPTKEATALFRVVDPFMVDLRATLQNLEKDQRALSGKIRIGAPMDFGSGPLTKLIGKFRQKFPDVSFEMTLAVPLKQLEMLNEGQLDLALIDNGDVHARKFQVSTQTLIKEEFVMVASEDFCRKKNLREFSFRNLGEMPIVDYLPQAPVARLWFQHHFGKEPQNLQTAFSAESVRAVLTAILADVGIGVVPDRLIDGEFKGLRVIETPRGRFVNQIVLARPLARRPALREKEFVNFLKKEIKIFSN